MRNKAFIQTWYVPAYTKSFLSWIGLSMLYQVSHVIHNMTLLDHAILNIYLIENTRPTAVLKMKFSAPVAWR